MRLMLFPRLRRGDPLAFSMLLAAFAHAITILGVSFSQPASQQPSNLPTLDVTVVVPDDRTTPEQADFIANATQDGAGNTDERRRPLPEQRNLSPAPATRPVPDTPQPVMTRLVSAEKTPERKDNPSQARNTSASAAELIRRSLDLVARDEQWEQTASVYGRRLRHTHISTRSRYHKYAAYMSEWVSRVERVGELNYPEEARARGMSGTLRLDVALNPDGSIQAITIMKASGHKLLDDAAVRIARLAAPFAPFPAEIRRETDILHITRTWEFSSAYGLQSR